MSLGFSLLRSVWTLGQGQVALEEAPSSGGAWGPHLEEQGVWEATPWFISTLS